MDKTFGGASLGIIYERAQSDQSVKESQEANRKKFFSNSHKPLIVYFNAKMHCWEGEEMGRVNSE